MDSDDWFNCLLRLSRPPDPWLLTRLVLSAWFLLGEKSLGMLQANSADGADSDEIGPFL